MLLTAFFFWMHSVGVVLQVGTGACASKRRNSYFKDLAHRIQNFMNSPKSLAHRHQAWSCYIYSSSAAGGRIFKDFATGPGMVLCNL